MSKNLITGYFGKTLTSSPGPSKPLFNIRKRSRSSKISLASVGNDPRQLVLDAGQNGIGPTMCQECGMAYSIDRPEDLRAHKIFHDQTNAEVILFPRFSLDKIKRITKYWYVSGIYIVYVDKSLEDLKGSFERIVETSVNKEVGFCQDLTVWGDDIGRFGCLALGPQEDNGSQLKVLGVGIFDLLDEAFWENKGTSFNNSKLLGVNRIWVHKQERGKGVASRLIGCARRWAIHGMTIGRRQVAFSEPTDNGRALAQKYCRFPDDDILIYHLKKK